MGSNRTKVNIPMFAALVLLCLTMISTHLTSGLYARYTTTATGSDGARVAKFAVTQNIQAFSTDMVLDILPGETKIYTVAVTNDSEVAISNTITVENTTGNLPLTFTVSESGASSATYAMSANANTTDYSISVFWPEDNAQKYMGMVDLVKITVTSTQID